ncbi:hypothetical protein BLTE_01040 [Blastochloris tepida]|uniref:Uncharacterized protein n=1 Tax=Blastochloris tepida TaxID=2233851 RepID=A0A348FVT6_9HYPH|nr:hypothetical protein BLTE_01040 [Blastochloris tepida]
MDTGCAKDPKGRVSENATNQKLRAFSAQVDTGCAKDPKGRVSENATNQKLGASDLMQSDRITLQ